MDNQASIAMVIPLYNEESRFESTYWQRIVDLNPTVQWVFIDDGSKDLTFNLLTGLLNPKRKNIQLVKSDINKGKGESIRCVFQKLLLNEEYNFIGFVDSDGAFGQKDIFKLLNLTQNLDDEISAIFTSRISLSGRNIQRSKLRHYLGRIVITFILFPKKDYFPWDTQAGMKIYRNTKALQKSFEAKFRTRWLFEIEHLKNYKKNTRCSTNHLGRATFGMA